ncbi:MAG: hypothetical protein AB8H80_09055 [Planctomycetota bacterium]
MNLESHATPYGGSPQQRYATLHRAIEQGIDSDDIWSELAEVSVQLGHDEESRRCAKRIRDDARRKRIERTCFPEEARARERHLEQSGSTAAGVKRRENEQEEAETPGVGEHLLDSVQYLMHQQMPWLVLTTMLAFPLVVGVGGFLTAGGSPLLLAAIAALPGISILAIVAAMGHEILTTSCAGESDVPDIPPIHTLIRNARDFLCDACITLLAFFGLPIALTLLGVPLQTTLLLFAAAALLAPLAFALRQVRRDMSSFSPRFLFGAVRGAGTGYSAIALCSSLAFAPAIAVAIATIGRPVWVQIAIVGPLCVLPVFSVARLLGSWLDTRRDTIGHLLGSTQRARAKAAHTDSANGSGSGTTSKGKTRRELHHPKGKNTEALPLQQAVEARRDAQQTRRRAKAANPQKKPKTASAIARKPKQRKEQRSIEGRRPAARRGRSQSQNAPQGRQQHAAEATKAAARSSQQERQKVAASAQSESSVTDLLNLPGAVVVRGNARSKSGAAARR